MGTSKTSQGWTTKKLENLLRVKHGYAFKGEYFSASGPYIILTPGNFYEQGGFRLKNQEKYYTGDFPHEYILGHGDLIVVMTEQASGLLGSPAFVPQSGLFLHNQRLGLITELNDLEIDKHFLYYLFNTQKVRAQISATASGTKVRHTSPSRIYEVEVDVPPLPTQRKIAAILSAYDDLMENNTRRIAILEEMAQMLYREWFVRFRFPGHGSVRLVDSPLGPIPEGWEITTIGEVSAYLNRGVSPTYDDESSSRVINQKCIRDGRLNMELSRGHSTKVPSEKFVQFGDVLINSTGEGTLGRVVQVYSELPDCTVDSHVTIVRPRALSTIDYFGLQLLNLQPYFSVMGFGATNQTELGRQTIANAAFLLPPCDLQERFSETVVPMRNSVVLLLERNALLRTTRDLLLPRLISGELDVAELEIAGD